MPAFGPIVILREEWLADLFRLSPSLECLGCSNHFGPWKFLPAKLRASDRREISFACLEPALILTTTQTDAILRQLLCGWI
jgi:hypothetical protein